MRILAWTVGGLILLALIISFVCKGLVQAKQRREIQAKWARWLNSLIPPQFDEYVLPPEWANGSLSVTHVFAVGGKIKSIGYLTMKTFKEGWDNGLVSLPAYWMVKSQKGRRSAYYLFAIKAAGENEQTEWVVESQRDYGPRNVKTVLHHVSGKTIPISARTDEDLTLEILRFVAGAVI